MCDESSNGKIESDKVGHCGVYLNLNETVTDSPAQPSTFCVHIQFMRECCANGCLSETSGIVQLDITV